MAELDYKDEVWKGIEGYEGLYQVSNFGRVKSLERVIIRKNGKPLCVKEKLLKARKHTDGHLFISLYKNGMGKNYKIHFLVAEAFIPNTENKPICHHIDKNKENNVVENLIWVTQKQHKELHPEIYEAISKAKSIPINQYDLQGKLIRKWKSSAEIQRELGFAKQTIFCCCNSGYFNKSRNKWVNVTQAYNFIWRYA